MEVVLKFVKQQIIEPFGIPKRIISDSSLCLSTAVTKFMENGNLLEDGSSLRSHV